jgi:DNA invertase Pin-like site-specific DNA recombinase
MRNLKSTGSRGRTALVYRRASSKEDLGAQRAAMARAARAHNYKVTQWYADSNPSKTKRGSALDRLRADIRAGHARTLLVSSLDRIGRTEDDLFSVLHEFRDAGATLVAVKEQIAVGPRKTTAKAGALEVLALADALAVQAERARIGERIAASRALRRTTTTKA